MSSLHFRVSASAWCVRSAGQEDELEKALSEVHSYFDLFGVQGQKRQWAGFFQDWSTKPISRANHY